jgi:hypothetical protein
MNYLDSYVGFTLFIKIMFVILLLADIILKKTNKNPTLQAKISYLKDKTESLFILLMALLLMYLFNPFVIRSVVIDYETKLLIFLFGFISILLRFKR